ncbi:uncharacterized protein [Chelonus insularis]|uniref:uncharacterized protein n=1 Tax=Chelonus insularis TaxID=460826 RepID=UPI00158B172D|nr:uncharacterized protein LOC118066442 [Chelonus insularis]
MELFSNPRYRVNIILLRVLGQWPFQPKIERFLVTLLWSTIISSLLVPQIHRCVIEPTEEILMSNIPPLITVSLSMAKMINSIFNGNKIRQLLMLMNDEWAKMKPGPSFDIMQKYANDGYKYTVFYCFLMYNSMVVFLLLPMRPKLMVWLGLSDVEAEFLLPFPTDYWINDDKYFIFIVMHVYFGTTFVITAIAGPDVLYMVFVQHVCGMFAEVSYRLENVPTKPLSDVDLYVDKRDDEAFLIISDCIRQHNRAIDPYLNYLSFISFSVRLEKTYSWLFLYVVCVNTLVLTFSGVQMMTHLDDVDELFRYIPFAGSQLMHIFVESIVAQQLMEHSSHVDYAITMMRWYAISLRSQKLLNLMTIRSRVLNKITAGKIFVLSLEFFGTVVKTSMTYFTLLRSMQEEEVHACIAEPTEEVIISNTPPLICVSISTAKMLNCFFNVHKVRQLLILMQDEWTRLKPGPGYDIMLKYANDGYKYTMLYCGLIYNSMVVFLLLPMRPKVLVWLGLSNADADYQLPFPTNYWVDTDQYFFYIAAHVYLGTVFVITAVVGPDVLFFMFVQHVCGLFAVVCDQLENIPIRGMSRSNLYIEKSKDQSFFIISDCIRQHNKAIEFAALVDDTFCWSFFFSVGMNTLIMTFSGIQLVTHLDDVDELFRYGPFAVGQMIHILVESIISQRLMDHSGQVDNSIIMMKWYAISLRSQKLLNLMTMRSRVLTKISAGRIFILSIEFFGVVVKTSMSYFTLLRSVKENGYYDE